MKVTAKIHDEIQTLNRSVQALSDVVTELRDDEQDKFDNHAEEWQDGDVGQETQTRIDELDNLAGELQDLADRIDEAFEL